jgi:Ca-activated chloride channel family protein
MQFGNPILLNWLWALPVLAVFLHLMIRYRQKKMTSFVQEGLIDQVTYAYSLSKIKRKNWLLLSAVGFLILALAKPQWGYSIEKVKQQGLDIILAVDVSKSMLTQDVKPDRLQRTKLAIKDLLKKVKGDRLGLMAFAGDAFMVCPLTNDYNGFHMSLDDLDINSIPKGGTNVAAAIREALKTFGAEQLKFKALVILTDGEEMQGDALQAVKEARDKGVRIFTIGIGTKEGELIKVLDEQGDMRYLKDDKGHYVKSQLNEELLQKIAYESSGAYVRSSGAEFGLDYLYTKEFSQWAKRDLEEKDQKKYHEQYQWFVGLATIFLGLSL